MWTTCKILLIHLRKFGEENPRVYLASEGRDVAGMCGCHLRASLIAVTVYALVLMGINTIGWDNSAPVAICVALFGSLLAAYFAIPLMGFASLRHTYIQDRRRARRLLAESGSPDGKKLYEESAKMQASPLAWAHVVGVLGYLFGVTGLELKYLLAML